MSEITVRPLEEEGEYAACLALQQRTWGEHFAELVPASLLKVAPEVGGVASGAFDGDRLVGMVFGISGIRDGRPAHWSDMLAVEASYRGRGLGRRLKLHQRDRLLAIGIERVLWTFDPLVARNAHLNLTRLGATARTYRRDVYGVSDSPLHAGIGTDRILADWELRSPRVLDRLADVTPAGAPRPDDDAPFLAAPAVDPGPFPRPGPWTHPSGAERVRLAVPSDIQALKQAEPALALEWRHHTREALEGAFEDGYAAVELERVNGAVSAYTLARGF